MIVLQAPAKVNLWLKICGRYADGFHELDTFFARLALSDEIRLEPNAREIVLEVTGAGEEIPTGAENLVWRAAKEFCEAAGGGIGVRIALQKRIPAGAGLGGGSSDAAAVLQGLCKLYPGALQKGQVFEIAARLGSDVPFFLLSSPGAFGRGRGEVLEPANPPWSGPILLIKPPFGISTPWAYKNYAVLREQGEISFSQAGAELWRNDLETPVFRKFLVLEILKGWLLRQSGVHAALLCGSGSTMFAALEDPDAAEPIAAAAHKEFGITFWTCKTEICRAAAGEFISSQ